jgi:flagellar hook assembly protein FlgD
VTIRLYDASDRKIRTPGNEPKPAGFHHIIWNGQDHAGKTAGSGVYLYVMTAGSFVESKQMMMLT